MKAHFLHWIGYIPIVLGRMLEPSSCLGSEVIDIPASDSQSFYQLGSGGSWVGDYLRVEDVGGTWQNIYAFMKFDVSGIPSDAEILSLQLLTYYHNHHGLESVNILHSANDAWQSGDGGFPNDFDGTLTAARSDWAGFVDEDLVLWNLSPGPWVSQDMTDGIASLVLAHYSAPDGSWVEFYRHLNPLLPPVLRVEYDRGSSMDDQDDDGVPDSGDNCPTTPNSDQADGDSDGTGDACDACPGDAFNDADGDGICGDVDNCPAAANPDQLDSDGDGSGNACDACPLDPRNDEDADGLCADEDNCPAHANPGQEDADTDGIGDACDWEECDGLDNDGDGLVDEGFGTRLYALDAGVRLLGYDISTGGVSVCGTGFVGAFNVAADEEGNLYVADFGAGTIYRVAAGCGEKRALTRWTLGGPPTPWAIVYHEGYLYVSDRASGRVLEIDPVSGEWSTYLSGVQDAVALAFDPEGNLFVATHNGAYLAKYGAAGQLLSGQWARPSLGYVDISGIGICGDVLYFTGTNASALYACDLPNGECENAADFWTNGLHNPYGVACDCRGNVYISNAASTSIVRWDPVTGRSLLVDDSRGAVTGAAGPYGLLVLNDGSGEPDSDGDGAPDSLDGCPNDPEKLYAGICGCGVADTDTDGDSVPDCLDECPQDPAKTRPGVCGCGLADTDTDGDGAADCMDGCPQDPAKTAPGTCGCGMADRDSDSDGTADCMDGCPQDPAKTAPGECGCGVADTDSDGDGVADCLDDCPQDPNKTGPGLCGCGVPDTDSDGDTVPDCRDVCPGQDDRIDENGNGVPDGCEGTAICSREPDEFTVAWWRFNEGSGVTAHDSGPHNANGVLVDGAGWTEGPASCGFALDLPTYQPPFGPRAESVEITIPDPSLFYNDLLVNNQITLEALIKPTSIPGAVYDGYVLGIHHGPSLWVTTYLTKPTGNPSVLYMGVGLIINGMEDYFVGVIPLRIGDWNHIAATYDGEYVRLFNNGVMDSEFHRPGTLDKLVWPNPRIGGWGLGNGAWFVGQVDEVCMSKTARYSAP